MKAVFGKSWPQSFTIRVDGETVEPYSLTSARLYSDKPTEAQREDHSNALNAAVESVTNWSIGEQPGERIVPFSALTDSDPHSSTGYEEYYLVVSAKLESGGSDVFVCEEVIRVWRPDAIITRADVTVDDFKERSKVLAIECENSEIDDWISRAERYTLKRLQGVKGWHPDSVNHEDLHDLIVLRAVYYGASAKATEGDGTLERIAENAKAEFDELLELFPIGYDFNKNNDIEPSEKSRVSSSLMIR